MCLWKKECKIGGFQDKIESIVGKPTFIIMKLTSLESLYLAQFQSAIFILTPAYFRCQKWWYLLVVCKNNKLCRAILALLYSDYIIHSTGIDHGQPREGRPWFDTPLMKPAAERKGGRWLGYLKLIWIIFLFRMEIWFYSYDSTPDEICNRLSVKKIKIGW